MPVPTPRSPEREGKHALPRLLKKILLSCSISAAVAATAPLTATPAPEAKTAPPLLQRQAPAGAPNVVLVLLDDVGFGSSSTFGGPVATPNIDALARDGLRYNRFHTTAICSPTRASLLTGRNPHATGIGAVINAADARPGYSGMHGKDTATIAEVLRQNGYSTAAFGKWHQTADWESSAMGPFDHWPTGEGFETFYGFMGGAANQFDPDLIEGTTRVRRPAGKDYHLTTDLVDRSIQWLQSQRTLASTRPFFLYLAPGATHAPLQAPKQWIDRYRGQFDQGWDKLREESFARQKRLGVIPADTVLTPRPDGLPAWDSLTADQRKVAARLMEVYAGYLAHTDAEVGRLIDALKAGGQYDNTLFIYIVGDNGASAEGGISGSINYMGAAQGFAEGDAAKLARIDEIGSATTYPHFNAGWAWALNAPFQWTKTIASHLGGTRNPMVIAWPKGIADRGGLRSQFGHVNDIAPTILEAAHITMPGSVNGIVQKPLDGTSLIYSFSDASSPERHHTQYFEVLGHRAIYHDGWMASAFHSRLPWAGATAGKPKPFEADRWELYDLRSDYSQAHDLAQREPRRLAAMQKLFLREAARNQVLPLAEPIVGEGNKLPTILGDGPHYTFTAGAAVPEKEMRRMLNRSWTLSATIDAGEAPRGVVAAMGGNYAGWSLYVDSTGRPVFVCRLFDLKTVRLVADKPLAPGRNSLRVDFDYDGSGRGKGGELRLSVNAIPLSSDRLPRTPPATLTNTEGFDVGIDSGSPTDDYPATSGVGYPFAGGRIDRVDIELR
ncbi:MAG: arylsulfatase [Sphingopyxis sp.]|nr:arylsulfatase [Sphingopyxis sp.]